MFCSHCGVPVQPGQVFCSRCGQRLAESVTVSAVAPPKAPPPATTAQTSAANASTGTTRASSLAQHIRILGILWIIYSGLRLIPGMTMLFLGHVRFPFLLAPIPGEVRGFVGPLLAALGGAISVMAIAGVIGGLGLMSYNSAARVLIIILACINLIHVPFGTALGIYTLWVLFTAGADREYQRLGASHASPANRAV